MTLGITKKFLHSFTPYYIGGLFSPFGIEKEILVVSHLII